MPLRLRRVAGASGTPSMPAGDRARRLQLSAFLAVLLVGLVIRIALIQARGYHDDMIVFYGWFRNIASLPPSQVYAHTPGLNYPPAYVVLSEIAAHVLRLFVPGTPSEAQLNIALKLPPILFDLAGAVLAFAIVRRRSTFGYALAAAAFVALNPAIVYDSAYWGQDDSVPTVCALFALWALVADMPIVAWPAIAFAALVKPPVLLVVPLMLVYPFIAEPAKRKRAGRQTLIGIAAAAALTELLAGMFFAHPTPFVALRHLAGQMVAGASYFPYNSLNSFNVWALFQPFFVSDSVRFLRISEHVWGDLLFICVAVLIYWRFATARRPQLLFEASALVLLAFFLTLTEMHERYLYYGVVFMAATIARQPYRSAALLLSLTLLLNLEYGLTFMYLDDAHVTVVNRYAFAPWLAHLCALANVGTFGWLLIDYLGWREPLEAALRRFPDALRPAT